MDKKAQFQEGMNSSTTGQHIEKQAKKIYKEGKQAIKNLFEKQNPTPLPMQKY